MSNTTMTAAGSPRSEMVFRAAIWAMGAISATFVLMLATLELEMGWIAVPLGAAFVGLTTRVALRPNAARLVVLAVAIVAVNIGVRALLSG